MVASFEEKISIEQIEQELLEWLHKYPLAKALYMEQNGEALSLWSAHVSANPLPAKQGIVLSAWINNKFVELSRSVQSIEDINKAKLQWEKQIQKTSAFSGNQNSLDWAQETFLQDSFTALCEESLFEKIDEAKQVLETISSLSPLVVNAQVHYRLVHTREFYLSKNRKLSQQFSRFEAIFLAFLKDQQNSIRIHDGFAHQGGWKSASPQFLEKMIADGKKILTAQRIPPGFYDCVFSPSVAGILAHEAFGHGTEADTMLKNRSKGKDYLNKQVASSLVHLSDSPNLEKQAASYFFDHEGQLAKETVIVENGILKNPITDFYSASSLHFNRTANGRRESYDHKVYTRMSNTYFKGGSDTLADMIASIENGFFVDRATNGMEDPKEWGIQLEALYAERIVNGKLSGEVFSPIIITGSVPDILHSISMVSNKVDINGLGMCGKGHKEWVKVTDGGPFLKLRARLA